MKTVGYIQDIPRAARNPGRYAKSDPVGGAVLLALALALIVTARKGARPGVGLLGGYGPSGHELVVFLIFGAVVGVSAQVLPDLVTTLLVVALLVIVLGQSDLFAGYISRGFAQLQKAAA